MRHKKVILEMTEFDEVSKDLSEQINKSIECLRQDVEIGSCTTIMFFRDKDDIEFCIHMQINR